jgi:hypothetical protein
MPRSQIKEHTMKARMLTGASLAAILALPVSAQAAGTLSAGPVKVRDYEMTVVGSDGGARDSFTVMFRRTSGKSTQQHMYTFASGVKVTATSMRGSLGRYGSVNLKLRNARKTKSSVPAGCTGRAGSARSGTFTGSFRLVADTTYFRTVTARKLPGMAMRSGNLRCGDSGGGGNGGGGGDAAGEPMLTHTKTDGAAMFTFTARRSGQTVMQMEDRATTAPAQIMHMISGSGNGLVVGGGGLTATSKAISPFLSGTGDFTGEGGAGTVVTGTLAGDLRARFDSIGAIGIAGDAMLMNP